MNFPQKIQAPAPDTIRKPFADIVMENQRCCRFWGSTALAGVFFFMDMIGFTQEQLELMTRQNATTLRTPQQGKKINRNAGVRQPGARLPSANRNPTLRPQPLHVAVASRPNTSASGNHAALSAAKKTTYRKPNRRALRRRRLAVSVLALAGTALFVCAVLGFGGRLLDKLLHNPADTFGGLVGNNSRYPFAQSSVDFNQNGVDDYTDFLLGARKDAENFPTYDGSYWDTGYPPDDIGVCTDVVWRAFKQGGYCLRDMVDADIRRHLEYYPVADLDANIDFRRVGNLRVFFDRYAQSLSLDIDEVDQWQAGDIVVFEDDKHIGIVSDKRNAEGRTFIIHNSGQPQREEDILGNRPVTGHYRFDASAVPDDVLVAWVD